MHSGLAESARAAFEYYAAVGLRLMSKSALAVALVLASGRPVLPQSHDGRQHFVAVKVVKVVGT